MDDTTDCSTDSSSGDPMEPRSGTEAILTLQGGEACGLQLMQGQGGAEDAVVNIPAPVSADVSEQTERILQLRKKIKKRQYEMKIDKSRHTRVQEST